MGLFDRYMAKAILSATLLVLLVIISLDALFGLVGESRYVTGSMTYTYWHALIYIFMRIPSKIIEFLPTITLIGSLLGLGVLASNSELIAMRAAGMSRGRIIWGGMKTGLLIGLVMLLIGEYVTPKSELRAATFWSQSNGMPMSSNVNEFWDKNGNDFIYINKIESNYHLSGVKVFTVQDQILMTKQEIEQAELQNKNWKLTNVTEKQYKEEQINSLFAHVRERGQLVDADLFEVAGVKPRNMSLTVLNGYIEYLDKNILESSAYRKAFWKKITGPLSILVMMLIAMPFVFSNRRAGNTGARLVLGIMFGMSYYIVSEVLGHLGQVYNISVLVSAFTPLVVFTGFGFFLLYRSEQQ